MYLRVTLTNGIDLSASYRLRTRDYGTFNFTSTATCVQRYECRTNEGGEWLNNVGVHSGTGVIFRW